MARLALEDVPAERSRIEASLAGVKDAPAAAPVNAAEVVDELIAKVSARLRDIVGPLNEEGTLLTLLETMIDDEKIRSLVERVYLQPDGTAMAFIRLPSTDTSSLPS